MLRNQLFTAALQGGDAELKNAALNIETGYQTGDTAFLKSCEAVSRLAVGKLFLQTQSLYWR